MTSGRQRILVVDDQDGPRQTLGRVLASLGYETEFARDGTEALAKLSPAIGLVMLDADMPTMDGFEVARRIRDRSDTARLPIIMITGSDGEGDRRRAAEVGINAFVSKPFELAEIRRRTAALLQQDSAPPP